MCVCYFQIILELIYIITEKLLSINILLNILFISIAYDHKIL